jgi:hypothetical protein
MLRRPITQSVSPPRNVYSVRAMELGEFRRFLAHIQVFLLFLWLIFVLRFFLRIEKCAWACSYFAEKAAALLLPEFVPTDGTQSYSVFQPLGVILAVMPWNYPFWQVLHFAAPAQTVPPTPSRTRCPSK